jgi:hypothetical protein
MQGSNKQEISKDSGEYYGLLSPNTIYVAKETEGRGFWIRPTKVNKVEKQKTPIKSKIPSLPPLGQPKVIKATKGTIRRNVVSFKIILWVLSLVAIIAMGYLIYTLLREDTGPGGIIQNSNQIPVSVVDPSLNQDSTSAWLIYTSNQGFSFKYPRNVVLNEYMDGSVGLSLTGTNNFSVSFKKGELKDRHLKDYVEERFNMLSGVEGVTKPIQSIIIAGLTGYEFSAVGLGEFRYQYLNADNGAFLEIIDVIQSKNDSHGSREVIDLILSTVEVVDDYTSS